MRFVLMVVLIACGSEQRGAEPQSPPEPVPQAGYDLHEWGLLTVAPGVVELGAGPGTQPAPQPPEIVVEKPVIYVHATEATQFNVRVVPGNGYALAERWPGSGTPLQWDVRATGSACAGQTTYPTTCDSADGYCETRELAAYEAADASCLLVGEQRASLLFYRFRAEPDVAANLPVQISAEGVRASSARVAWRVRGNASGVQTWRIDLNGTPTPLAESGAQGAPAAAAWMHHELERRGLTDAERSAFERAWWSALFGMDVSAEQSAIEEDVLEEVVAERSASPNFDTLLYFLEDTEITAVARLDAQPAPRRTRRVFVVRHRL